ncbi:hypothetical protein DMENIID0001_039090 [Sergentomyia squamirostris]
MNEPKSIASLLLPLFTYISRPSTAGSTDLCFNFGLCHDTPICATDKILIVGAGKDENVEIVCDIHADPPARTFRWKFNNSGETLDVGSGRYSSINGTRSILHYTPVTDQVRP